MSIHAMCTMSLPFHLWLECNMTRPDKRRSFHEREKKNNGTNGKQIKIQYKRCGVQLQAIHGTMNHGSWMMCEVAKIICVEYRRWPNIDETTATATATKMKMNWQCDFVHSILFLLPLKWRRKRNSWHTRIHRSNQTDNNNRYLPKLDSITVYLAYDQFALAPFAKDKTDWSNCLQ